MNKLETFQRTDPVARQQVLDDLEHVKESLETVYDTHSSADGWTRQRRIRSLELALALLEELHATEARPETENAELVGAP